MTTHLTVIIPTYNRAGALVKCLHALEGQTYPKPLFEVLVVDDGSSDGTGSRLTGLLKSCAADIKYLRQDNKGPAAARNLGIKRAAGEIVLFLGDDIIASPDLLERHAAWHRKNAEESMALLGYVTWDPGIEITPFMAWLENGGPQFNFTELTDGEEADPGRYFYTCNISLKRGFLEKNGMFDEDFPYAAFEDVELGRRLKAAGLKLYFEKKAAAWHRHYTSLADACGRMIKVGESKKILDSKAGLSEPAPAQAVSPARRVLKRLKIIIYYRLAAYYEKRKIAPGLFKYVLDYYYNLGRESFKGARK